MIRMLAGLVLLLLTTEVLAVAFCSLRDPVQQIQTMYPGFTGYTSEVRELKPSVAKSFIDRSGLPVSIHAKEIGKHTLFYVQEGLSTTGLVHVRSEPGRWGLIEIVWSLDTNGDIKDFMFQRCRGGDCKNAETQAVKSRFKGLNVRSIGELFDDDGSVTASQLPIQGDFFEILVKSAAKTLILTQAFWSVPMATDPYST